MFIFVEGDDNKFSDIFIGELVWHNHIYCNKMTFPEAIVLLSKMKDRKQDVATVFYHFFSSISHLENWQKRGLERIAMADNAVEVPFGCERQSRFMAMLEPTDHLNYSLQMWNSVSPIYQDGIGNFTLGNVLLVGDRPGKGNFGYNTPFVGGGSGMWITKQLEAANIPEDKYYWINSHGCVGEKTDFKIIQALRPQKVIALGNEAFKWVNEAIFLECEIDKVPHPQYWKRFKSGEVYPLIDLLTK